MTTSTAIEVDKRKLLEARAREQPTFAGSLAARIRQDQLFLTRVRFPSDVYSARPIEFFREVLGVEPWERQREIIEAVREHDRVAISSGHKISKSLTAAGLALWFYCSFEDARAIMSSTTSRQVDQILWRELRMLRARAGRCLDCKAKDPEGLRIPRPCPHSTLIEGEIGELARTGLKALNDFREIVGFTAREAEAVAGISGRNLLYLIDEASGVPPEIYDAIEGNRAGGAKIVLFGNPTRNMGTFYDCFHSKKRHWKTLRVSSEETPNVVQGRVVIPGLATREWIDEKKDEWGEDSPLYRIRVKGEFAQHEEGRIFSVHFIGEAEARWHTTSEAGRLFVGVDPAGASGDGDETVLCVRRGLKQLEFRAWRGLSAQAHVTVISQAIEELRLPRELPVVVVDSEGPIGYAVSRMLRDHADTNPNAFELFSVRASDKAFREPKNYERVREELVANLLKWMRDGGAIVEDARLADELHSLEWILQVTGKYKLTPKSMIRKQLGRSPDRLDALALSVWEAATLAPETSDAPVVAAATDEYAVQRTMDPWAGAAAWRADPSR